MTPDAVSAYVARFGLRVECKRVQGNQWVGDGVLRASDLPGILHELAHWQIAPPRRRKLVGFGLGPEPEGAGTSAPGVLSGRRGQREEERASLLGIAHETALGADPRDTLRDHSWDCEPNRFWQTVAWLERRGYLRGGRPIGKVNGVTP